MSKFKESFPPLKFSAFTIVIMMVDLKYTFWRMSIIFVREDHYGLSQTSKSSFLCKEIEASIFISIWELHKSTHYL